MDVVIIGSGNTATVLGRKLKMAGNRIVQIAGRNAETVQVVASELGADPLYHLSAISPHAGLYLVAVPDGAIGTVVNGLPLDGQTIVHTAAAVSIDILKEKTSNYGVLYPLQSLRKGVKQSPAIPFLVDASNEETLALLIDLAQTIGAGVQQADDTQRVKTHLAAVLVNNFTNHLFALASDYCRQENISFSLLLPLMEETVRRLHEVSPAAAQTGPAVRNDLATVEKHLALLHDHPQLKGLYRQLTESILQFAARLNQE